MVLFLLKIATGQLISYSYLVGYAPAGPGG
jgi:hypothetical protein